MDELAPRAIGADSLLVEGVALSALVVGVEEVFVDQLVRSVGKLALLPVGATAIPGPLPAHFCLVL